MKLQQNEHLRERFRHSLRYEANACRLCQYLLKMVLVVSFQKLQRRSALNFIIYLFLSLIYIFIYSSESTHPTKKYRLLQKNIRYKLGRNMISFYPVQAHGINSEKYQGNRKKRKRFSNFLGYSKIAQVHCNEPKFSFSK